MLVKLKFMFDQIIFNPSTIKKIIIILLAIFIAAITTSFGFGIKKAHGDHKPAVKYDKPTLDLEPEEEADKKAKAALKAKKAKKTLTIHAEGYYVIKGNQLHPVSLGDKKEIKVDAFIHKGDIYFFPKGPKLTKKGILNKKGDKIISVNDSRVLVLTKEDVKIQEKVSVKLVCGDKKKKGPKKPMDVSVIKELKAELESMKKKFFAEMKQMRKDFNEQVKRSQSSFEDEILKSSVKMAMNSGNRPLALRILQKNRRASLEKANRLVGKIKLKAAELKKIDKDIAIEKKVKATLKDKWPQKDQIKLDALLKKKKVLDSDIQGLKTEIKGVVKRDKFFARLHATIAGSMKPKNKPGDKGKKTPVTPKKTSKRTFFEQLRELIRIGARALAMKYPNGSNMPVKKGPGATFKPDSKAPKKRGTSKSGKRRGARGSAGVMANGLDNLFN